MGLEDISWHPYIPKPKRKRMNEARESGPKMFYGHGTLGTDLSFFFLATYATQKGRARGDGQKDTGSVHIDGDRSMPPSTPQGGDMRIRVIQGQKKRRVTLGGGCGPDRCRNRRAGGGGVARSRPPRKEMALKSDAIPRPAGISSLCLCKCPCGSHCIVWHCWLASNRMEGGEDADGRPDTPTPMLAS
jgi:hypothetical protein